VDAGAPAGVGLAAFGLELLLAESPPGAWRPRLVREPELQIRSASVQEVEQAWSGFAEPAWCGFIDEASFVVERGVDGDHRFVHGAQPDRTGAPAPQTRAIHHLSADAAVLRCAPIDRSDPSWWRVVLDSVLFTVALLRGYEALHAGALATEDGAIALTAASGGGKSTLLAELLGRGHALVADDVLVLESSGNGSPLAHPAPPLMTVPTTSIPRLGKGEEPPTICSLNGESWIAVPVCSAPLPMRALVVLDRGPGSGRSETRPSLSRIENPLAPLLDSLMSFPGTPERERARFELASTLACECGVWRLAADPETPPSMLADVLLEGEL